MRGCGGASVARLSSLMESIVFVELWRRISVQSVRRGCSPFDAAMAEKTWIETGVTMASNAGLRQESISSIVVEE